MWTPSDGDCDRDRRQAAQRPNVSMDRAAECEPAMRRHPWRNAAPATVVIRRTATPSGRPHNTQAVDMPITHSSGMRTHAPVDGTSSTSPVTARSSGGSGSCAAVAAGSRGSQHRCSKPAHLSTDPCGCVELLLCQIAGTLASVRVPSVDVHPSAEPPFFAFAGASSTSIEPAPTQTRC